MSTDRDMQLNDSSLDEGRDPFGKYVYDDLLDKWKDNRLTWTNTWMKNWYNFVGTYYNTDHSRKNEGVGQRSKAFIKLTKSKVMSAYAQIVSIGFQGKELFDLVPRGTNPDRAEIAKAKEMKYAIQGQQDDGDLQEHLKTLILELCLYGTGWLEGPITRSKNIKKWVQDPMNLQMLMAGIQPEWRVEEEVRPVPRCFHRDLFYMYPDPFATSQDDSQGTIYAPLVSEFEIKGLKNIPGFDHAEIDKALADGPSQIPIENQQHQVSKYSIRGITDFSRSAYELITFMGVVDGKKLGSFRKRITGADDGTGIYNVFAWIIKGAGPARTAKIVVNPYTTNYMPMNRAVYEQNLFEINGNGVATNMSDVQDIVNSATRLYIDSKAFAGIPMVGINRNLLNLKGGKLGVYPGKVFEFNSDPTKAMHLMTITDSSDGLLKLIQLMERFGDEASGVTKYTQGSDNKSLNRTATGISMIMNTASQTLKAVGENIDMMLERVSEGYYQWNMEFNPNNAIKGDYIVRSNGISNAMSKEILNQQLMQFLGFIMQPQLYQVPGALKLVRRIGDTMGIKNVDDLLPSDEEVQQMNQQNQMMQQLLTQNTSNPTRGVAA